MEDSDDSSEIYDILENLENLDYDNSKSKYPKGKNILIFVLILFFDIVLIINEIDKINNLSFINAVFIILISVVLTAFLFYFLFKIDFIEEFDLSGFILYFISLFIFSFGIVVYIS